MTRPMTDEERALVPRITAAELEECHRNPWAPGWLWCRECGDRSQPHAGGGLCGSCYR